MQLQFFPSEVSNYVSYGDDCILISQMIRTIYDQYSVLICMYKLVTVIITFSTK